MKLLAVIGEYIPSEKIDYETFDFSNSKEGVRAVLLNNEGLVSVQHLGLLNYHELPGGGIEVGESEEVALRREIVEEVGCQIVIKDKIGVIIEYRYLNELPHVSHAYLCGVEGEERNPSYKGYEVDQARKPVWMSLDDALSVMENYPEVPHKAQFIVEREKRFLEEAKKFLVTW
jgi:8-oxo-dGTP diphosphatase